MRIETGDLEKRVNKKKAGERFRQLIGEDHLWSVGASIGTSFSAPWVIGTVHGTIAPFKHSFLELGLDFGMVSGNEDAQMYYTLYPFIHYALFLPLNKNSGWYAGVGCGYMYGEYTFSDEKIPVDTFAFDAVTGLTFFEKINITYTMRSNFKSANNKLSFGYIYRFR